MKKIKFKYNPETLTFEKIETSVRHIVRLVITHLLSGVGISIIVLLCVYTFLDSPKERQLKKEMDKMEAQYKVLSKKYDKIDEVLEDLSQRDNNLYRIILEADTMPDVVKNDNILLNNKYDQFLDMSSYELLFDVSVKADYIEERICQQSESYDEIVKLLKSNSEKIECVPAIQPLMNRSIKSIASGFGWRVDPIFHTKRMHTGMDFSAAKGTPIYATGKGVVIEAGYKQGYGNCVVIDHGFGYKTLYAHMNKIKVRNRQKVARAQEIGSVGSTGKSTGAHLHYEVHHHDIPVDPVNFYYMDLSPQEYDKMLQIAANAGQVLD